MDSDISVSQYDSAKRYIDLLHFLARYHLSFYKKQKIYYLTDKSFWKGDVSGSRYII